MAKIVATYDTDTKKVNVTIDGVDQGNVSYFSCYNEKDYEGEVYGGCSMELQPVKDSGVTYRMSARASKFTPEMTDKEKLALYFKDCLHKK